MPRRRGRRGSVLASILAALLFGLAGATPIYAHDAAAPTAPEEEKRREARQLTEELKKGGPSAAKSPAARQRLIEQAERRRDLVNELARRDPKGALDVSLDAAERGALPDFVRSLVEEWVKLDGELQVVHVDDEDGGGEYDIRLVKDGRERPLRFGNTLKNVKPGDEIRVEGIALAGEPTVVADQVSVASAASGVGPTGAQRTAIILASAPGVGTHPYASKDNTASIFFSSANPKSARSFFLEASYGQSTVVGKAGAEGTSADVYGPYTLSSATCDFYTVRDQALKAADPNVTYGSYDRVVISWNHAACGNGGAGTVRTQSVGSYDGADQQLSVALIFNGGLGATTLNGAVSGVALHEYGHNLGVWHANALECGSVGVGSGGCSSNEYGDPSDLMGNTGGYGHFNAVHKDILTWLGGGRSQDVSGEGSYTIGAYEAAGSGVRALKIPRTRDASGAVNGHYYLEYRKPTSAWNAFLTGRPDYGNGVLIHTSGTTPFCTSYCPPDFSGGGGGGDSHLVDTQPASASGSGDFNDAPLVNGESYTDPMAGVTVRVTATGTVSATVQVSFSTPSLSVQSVVYPEGAGTVQGGGTYKSGQSATLTAVPQSGYTFVHWLGDRDYLSDANPYSFTINADRMVEAVFAVVAPENDGFPGRSAQPGRYTVHTGGASTQSGEPTDSPAVCAPTGKTVWYSYVPPAGGALEISTAGSSFDTVLAVYTGSAVNGLTPVAGACSDDADGGTTSRVSFTATAGTPYRVQVGGYAGGSGDLVLELEGATAMATLSIADASQAEGPASATFAVALSPASSQPVTVRYATANGTANGGASCATGVDYVATSGTLTIPAGSTSGTVSVALCNEMVVEADEAFTVTLSEPTNATLADGQATGTIRNDDGPPLSIADVTAAEASANVTFTVRPSAASSQPITVRYATADGTASGGAACGSDVDYVSKSETLTIPANATSGTFTVSICADTVDEPNETFTVNLSDPTGATLGDGQALGTITDDDVASLTITDVSQPEGTASAVFTVRLSAVSPQDVSVRYATANGSARGGSSCSSSVDYVTKSGTLTIPAGSPSGTVTISLCNETLIEPPESFVVNLSNPVNTTIADTQGQGTIANDDVPSATINDVSLVEGATTANFTVRLSVANSQPVTVRYATANGAGSGGATGGGGCSAGIDYVSKSGTLTVPANATSATIAISVCGDTADEANETFTVTLSDPTNVALGDAQGVGTITDNDGPTLSVDDPTVSEGAANATFTVRLSAASVQAVTVNYATANGTARSGSACSSRGTDYLARTGTLTIPAGATSATVTVPICNDTAVEPAETLLLNLTSPVNATTADAQGRATISNND